MNHYPAETFSKISDLLEMSSQHHGANCFSIGDEVLPLTLAMDECGPIAWALILHSDAIVKQAGIATSDSTNILPFTCIVNPDTPFGNQAIVQPGKLPLSVGYAFLDAALEHCVCLGLQHYGYTPEEWDQLPPEEKVIPIEPYFVDLKENWITDINENGSPTERLDAWPTLLDRNILTHGMSQSAQQSQVLSFPSAR